jgi:mono/diheme cytochrome c family protein
MKSRGARQLATVVMAAALGAACDPSPVQTASGASQSSGGSGANRPRRAANDPPEMVEAGHQRFNTECLRCHGPESPGGMVNNLDVTNERLEAVLHAGSDNGGLMPAVAPDDLRVEHLPALRAYLRSIGALRVE